MKHLTKKELVTLLEDFPDDYIITVRGGRPHLHRDLDKVRFPYTWYDVVQVHDRFCGEDQVGMVTLELEVFVPVID